MANSFERNKMIKVLIKRAKLLESSIRRTLYDSSVEPQHRYVSFKSYARTYNSIVEDASTYLKGYSINVFNLDHMGNHMNTLWGYQKQCMEEVEIEVGNLIASLESENDFVDDEFENLVNFIKSKLRQSIFSRPEKEVEIQNAIEALFVGRNMTKGIDYDRESGKFEFSGKEYIPDFILLKMNLCIEVKLLREGKKSRIIDEINADITAYSTKYERLMFVVFDLGDIRDEDEFRRDIENAGTDIKVIIVKY